MTQSPSLLASWDACLDHTGHWLAAPSLGQLRNVPAGTLLYDQGAPSRHFFLIREGLVRCSMLHDSGRRLLLELMGPGTMFGEGAAFDGHPRYVHAETVTDARLSVYTKEDILRAPDPVALLQGVIKIMASKQRVLAGKLLEFNSEEPEGRLRHLLAKLVAVRAARSAGLAEPGNPGRDVRHESYQRRPGLAPARRSRPRPHACALRGGAGRANPRQADALLKAVRG